ncbi:MAG: 3-hydroxy-3-methylglutaryl-CoA reductase [Candidatus Peregrinibacteria bacterium Greene1014_49]|nr:MAG: 3-hydroxy-3-methylglutaryl-CoA reductase [Candidatus Peregrinibacteria bacterium Greene1014_49]
MNLRSLPPNLNASERIEARRAMIERELNVDCSALAVNSAALGHAEERNCENMFGTVPIPVGLAGPLTITLSDGTETTVHLPLATTEGALVASVNRGCKALRGVRVDTRSKYHGVTRSIAFRLSNQESATSNWILEHEQEWKSVGEATSSHLKILSYEIDEQDDHLFLTIAADTDEAMGMNMVTIAAQAIGEYIQKTTGTQFITVAANVDSDKKPSVRTYTKGRGYEASAICTVPSAIITDILKTTPEAILAVAKATATPQISSQRFTSPQAKTQRTLSKDPSPIQLLNPLPRE